MMRSVPFIFVLGLLVCLPAAGCVSGARGGTGSGSGEITRADIEASSARDGHQLVGQLRPQWLRGRGSTSFRNPRPSPPVVYVGGVREGGLDALRRLDTGSILSIEYLSAPDATTRFGTGHTSGAILVNLRR